MRWLLIIASLVFIAAAVYVYPMVNKERMCYDAAQQRLDEIQLSVVSKGWSQEDVCYQRSEALLDVEDCLTAATSGSTLAQHPQANKVIEGAVYVIRPLTKGLTTLKKEHNADCINFENYQVE